MEMNEIMVLSDEIMEGKRTINERLQAGDSSDRLKEGGEFEVEPEGEVD